MALDFLAGCVGGAAGIVVAHPLDTVKVRIQTQCSVNPKYRGTFHCLTATIKQESISGLYKGIASPLYGVTAINALIFGVYGQLKPLVEGSPGNNSLWAHFLAGSAAGAVQSVIASPMELVKTRMQLDESVTSAKGKGPSPWDVVKDVYRKGGIRQGIFKGWWVTLSREIPGLGAYFATYEALTRNGGREVTTLEMLFAGGMAGVASWISCFPMDVIKTRLQSDTEGKYSGTLDCYKKTVAREGYRALFRGLNSTLIRAFPSNAATFTVVTWVMRLGEQRLRGNEEGNGKDNLEMLLEQWDSVQENVKETLQWKIPQYAVISVASFSLDSTNHFYDRNGSNLGHFLTLGNQEARKYVPNEGRQYAGNEPGFLQRPNNAEELKKNINVAPMESNGSRDLRTERKSAPQNDLSSLEKEGMGNSNNISKKNPGNLSGCSGVGSSSKNELGSVRQANSHAAGSLPQDLTVLAEILDLPVVVLENSLEGKPLTLFYIFLAWLKQGTRFSLCKCLDALDQCVCFNW